MKIKMLESGKILEFVKTNMGYMLKNYYFVIPLESIKKDKYIILEDK